MAYLNNTEIFEAERDKWRSVILEDTALPAQVFKNPAGPFLLFEFDLFFTNHFLECLRRFLLMTNETTASFVVVDPNPIDYFYREFHKYPVVHFSTDESSARYLEKLSEDPGNSSADAIIYNSTKVVVYPPSLQWVIFGDRDFEWAILNCGSQEVCSRFNESCRSEHVHTGQAVTSLLRETAVDREDGGTKVDQILAEFVKNYGLVRS